MGRQKILIVEDDADISGLLVKIMEGAGYQVRQAFSGTEALFVWNGNYRTVCCWI